jgi:protein-S-isoprenylcysteine O-methyltransferase Ste14/uncharacterized membrane protein (UPF0127 family)
MPLQNLSMGTTYPITIIQADTLLTRLIGLLDKSQSDLKTGLHIVPCSGIHTFGLQYPIDVIFLDKNGVVVHTISRLPPNRIAKTIRSGRSVLELPPGTIDRLQLKKGTRLGVKADKKSRSHLRSLKNIFHWPINIFIAMLWSQFVISAVNDWLVYGKFLSLLILIHNTLLFLLFLTRRKSVDTSYRFADWMIPLLTLISTMMLRPGLTEHPLWIVVSGFVQWAGILCIILSLFSLGRSFGIVPANRKIIYTGAYKIVRHPLYASELVFYTGFILGNFSTRNLLLVVMILAGQLYRSIAEENLLSKDPHYQTYLQEVGYRFIPGLF